FSPGGHGRSLALSCSVFHRSPSSAAPGGVEEQPENFDPLVAPQPAERREVADQQDGQQSDRQADKNQQFKGDWHG
ncbi:hypothetical protein ACFCZR_20965, partial [Streptomyces rubiginosohelvolus]|uniref:hypothetical protein n=1 Tax=Streptomyces rubiginosohelvolus TaxID=67362 RepID=UPI0035D76CA1